MCEAAIETGAVANEEYNIDERHITKVWRAMIDAALKD
jgi:hypothetical protein